MEVPSHVPPAGAIVVFLQICHFLQARGSKRQVRESMDVTARNSNNLDFARRNVVHGTTWCSPIRVVPNREGDPEHPTPIEGPQQHGEPVADKDLKRVRI